ncbi:MAG: hypothetical protein ACLSFT_01905 [Ruminococcus callidus]
MLLHKHAAITKLFHDLRFIVIDEVHSLMRGDRGGQTICLIERLCRMAGVNPRRIGLSATIGDLKLPANSRRRHRQRNGDSRIQSKGVRWRLSMEHFYVQDRQAAEDNPPAQALPELAPKPTRLRTMQTPAWGIFSSTPAERSV